MPTIEATIQSLLGALVSGRCFPMVNPAPVVGQSYITFQEIHGKDMMITPPNRDEYRLQIDLWAATYGESHALAAQAKTAMDDATAFSTSMINRFDGFEEETKEYRHTLEYYIYT